MICLLLMAARKYLGRRTSIGLAGEMSHVCQCPRPGDMVPNNPDPGAVRGLPLQRRGRCPLLSEFDSPWNCRQEASSQLRVIETAGALTPSNLAAAPVP
jgi:hypothetical protein